MKYEKFEFAGGSLTLDNGERRLLAVVPEYQKSRNGWVVVDCVVFPLPAHHPTAINGKKLLEFPLVETDIRLDARCRAFVIGKANDGGHRRRHILASDKPVYLIIPISLRPSSLADQ